VVAVGLASCHREADDVALLSPRISLRDKFYSVAALSAEAALVVGYGGKILSTADGGRTWQERSSLTELALYDVRFVDGRTGWACGQGGTILRTVDGGRTWKRQRSGTERSLFSLFFIDAARGWAVGDKAVQLRTENGGESWQVSSVQPSLEGIGEDVSLAVVDPILYDVFFVDERTGWMAGEFGKIYRSDDGGRTWQEQQNSLVGQGGVMSAFDMPTFFAVRFANDREGAAVGLEGKVAFTRDGGRSWTFAAGAGRAGSLPDPLYDLDLLAGGDAWIVGAAGRVLRFDGQHWRAADLGLKVFSWLRAVDFYDESHGWIVGGYGVILRTEDGGRSWLPCLG